MGAPDIANTAYEEARQPHRPAGPTMFGARLLVEWMRNLRGNGSRQSRAFVGAAAARASRPTSKSGSNRT